MDDILSAALGQSGLNLSFLETHDKTDSGIKTGIKPVDDGDEDVTDLLNLLNSSEPENNSYSKDGITPDVLDMVLNYQSDEENSSDIPSPQPQQPIVFEGYNMNKMPSANVKSLTSFHTPTGLKYSGLEKYSKKLSQLTHPNVNNKIQCFSPASLLLNKLNKIPVKISENISQHKQMSTYQSPNDTLNYVDHLNDAKFNNEATSDFEKRKQSIKHVLSSPNLTVREKQFLMKSAITHNMVTVPVISPTMKMSSKRIAGSNSVVGNTDFDDDAGEDNEMMHTDTFAEYMPSKVKVGYRHPDPVVETSSMASVTPPDVWYNLMLPKDIIQNRVLSALQLESIIYASQQHEKLLPNGKRTGFLIGDGAGVGKGRTVAGIIYENYLHGRKKAIWLSVSNDLRYDAVRDLRDIGCHTKVVPLNKFKYDEKITSKSNGKFKKGVVFSTYSALISETTTKAKFTSRIDQLLHWFGKDYDGVVILDECHKAKNLMPIGSTRPTKTGLTVLKLQDQLPKARVVYCSATGASEPKNMAYMNRLGLWGTGTAFKEFTDFLMSVEKRGVGAMEMVAMDMKLRGMYMARQLSFTGVTFDITEVKLAQSFIEMYDAAVKLWVDARSKFERAADLVGLDNKGKKTMWGQFWSSHQRFFKYLCIAAKVKHAVNLAKDAIRLGKCVIFGLQSTGEARVLDQIDDMAGGELYDFISTTKGVFSILVDKHFPTTENPNKLNTERMEEKKRKRDERQKVSKRRRGEGSVQLMMSDDSSGSDSDTNEPSREDSDSFNSDQESDDSSNGSDKNPFEDDSSGSDDEDEWLSIISEERKYTGSEKNSRIKPKKEDMIDSSATALAAAGISSSGKYSWANSPTNFTAPKENNIKSNVPKTIKLEQQLCGMNALTSTGDPEKVCGCMKLNLLEQLDVIGPYLPPNTLDELIDELGGPDYVAEMTGRKSRIIAKDDGSFVYEPRTKDDVPLEILNVAEKKRFMNEEKLIAIISEAASSGISLQADRRVKNQRRRVHITLELPWSADKAIQQFGRSHRSNQVSAPEYLFLISELAGEQRFASIVAKRLESLGALTHGDRRSNESRDFSRYNFDTRYGRQALDTVLKSVIGLEKALVSLRGKYNESYLKVIKESLVGIGLIQKDEKKGVYSLVDKDYTNIPRFLNRILGLTVQLQNSLFQYFTDTLTTIIKEAKRSGRWDEGIVDLGSQGESVIQTDAKTFVCPATCGQVTTKLVTVSVERGLPFSRAVSMQEQSEDEREGFYSSLQLRNGKRTSVLILRECSSKNDLFSIYRPNIGLVQKRATWEEIQKKYVKSIASDVEASWEDQYEYSENNCVHAFWRGYCKKKIVGLPCEIGTRKRTCHILSGSVLSVWSKVESVLSCEPEPVSKMQIIRSKLDNGLKIVGLLIPSNCVDTLTKVLSADEDTYADLTTRIC